MKVLLLHIILLTSLLGFSQAHVGYLFEELPQDSLTHQSVQSHTSLKPRLFSYDSSAKKWSTEGIADLNAAYDTSVSLKTGIGFNINFQPSAKWHMRLAAVQGFGIGNSLNPKSFLYYPDQDGFAYTDIRSRASFTPNQFFNFQVGLDHQFLGEGSRSMLLSDYGVSNPFALIRTHFWQLEYNVLYQALREGSSTNWEGKFAASHHLSINPVKWLNIGIFESVLFQPIDTNLRRGFDVEYLNPIIFYRPQEYAIGSSDNVILGLDISARIKEHLIYGQFVIDEFYLSELRAKSGWWANKFGGQFGVKGRLLNRSLFYRLEYNFVRPYTFSHVSEELNYGNQGNAIGHPLGSNFMEVLGVVKYQKDKLLLKAFLSYVLKGYDYNGFSYGGDIYQSYVLRPQEYNNFIGQGLQRNTSKIMLTASYRILKHGNLNAFLENHFDYVAQGNQWTYFGVIGLRSFLWNDYRNY